MALSVPIVATAKISVPTIKPHLVERVRLHDALTASMSARVTPICAPAGYGKTTLLAMWMQKAGLRCGWFSIDDMDNDEIRFWRYVAHAAGRLLSGDAEARIVQLAQTLPAVSIITFIDALLNELTGLKQHAVLVLDDYHHIRNERIHNQLSYLIDYLPERQHLIIASRMALPFSTKKWRLMDQPSEKAGDLELSFSLEEASRYIRDCVSIPLATEQIERLQQRTEGWIVGLQLAAASLRSGVSFEQLLNSFKGDRRDIADYLFHEVLDRLPDELRDFLLEVSVLFRMDAELCDSVTGREGSAELLDALYRSNLFLIPIEDQHGWYRCHPLFAEYVSDRMKKSSQQRWRMLHARASEAMADRGFTGEAIEHAIASQQFAQLERLLGRQLPLSMSSGEIVLLLRWFDSFPDGYAIASELMLFHAFVLVLTGRLEDAETMLRRLEHIHNELKEEGASRERLDELLSGILFVRSNLVFSSGNFEGWFAFSEGILHQLAPENSAFYTFNYNLSEPFVRRTAMGMNGVLSEETEKMAQLFTNALDSHGWGEALINLYVKLSLAEGYYEWNRLEDCRKLLRSTEQAVFKRGLPGLLIPHRLTEARCYMAAGKPQLANQAFEEAWEIALASPEGPWLDELRAFRLRMYLQEGKLAAAKQTAEELKLSPSDKPTFNREFRYLSYVRLLSKLRKENDSLLMLELLRPQTEREGLLSSLAENAMLQALHRYQLGHIEEALPLLHEALLIGEANGYIRTFTDEGDAMKALLERYAAVHGSHAESATLGEAKVVSADYLGSLLAAFPAPKKARQLADAKLAEPLTRVEQDLLRQLQAGASNKQIAAELSLSEGTVKVYLSNLYGKLGVSSRTQALIAAQKMGL